MANIAVVQMSGAQQLITVGDILTVTKVDGVKEGEVYTPEVLLSTNGESVLFNAGDVVLKHIEDKKGEKIYVMRFKAKTTERKRKGYRHSYSTFEVISINGEAKK